MNQTLQRSSICPVCIYGNKQRHQMIPNSLSKLKIYQICPQNHCLCGGCIEKRRRQIEGSFNCPFDGDPCYKINQMIQSYCLDEGTYTTFENINQQKQRSSEDQKIKTKKLQYLSGQIKRYSQLENNHRYLIPRDIDKIAKQNEEIQKLIKEKADKSIQQKKKSVQVLMVMQILVGIMVVATCALQMYFIVYKLANTSQTNIFILAGIYFILEFYLFVTSFISVYKSLEGRLFNKPKVILFLLFSRVLAQNFVTIETMCYLKLFEHFKINKFFLFSFFFCQIAQCLFYMFYTPFVFWDIGELESQDDLAIISQILGIFQLFLAVYSILRIYFLKNFRKVFENENKYIQSENTINQDQSMANL